MPKRLAVFLCGLLCAGAARAAGEPARAARPVAAAPAPKARVVTAARTTAEIRRVAAAQVSEPEPPPDSAAPTLRRLRIPPGLPGANAPPIRLPPFSPDRPEERSEVIDRIFPALPGPPPAVPTGILPDGRPFTLDDLLDIARQNSPVLRQARADVISARGRAIDAGKPMNPQLGYEMDTVNTLGTAGYQGGMLNQTIKTAGKRQLARSAGNMEVRITELSLRKADVDLATRVQAGYYAVLVAQEAMKVMGALVQFTDETYRVQVEQTKGGEAAPYEPLQLRVLATQARAAAIQARNRYISAWKQLAATMAVPELPPTQLVGRIDGEIPVVAFDLALARVMTSHTDVLSSFNGIARARYQLRFEEVQPIPDVNTYLAVQKDYTGPPFGTTVNLQTYFTLPIFYRNQGGILNAQGNLTRASQDVDRVRNDLSARLASIFERYENTRTILNLYRNQILPDQARAYRGVFERHQQEPAIVSFGDIVVAQQILATTIAQYISILGDQYAALTDLENIVQSLDLAPFAPPPPGEVVQPPRPDAAGAPAAEPAPPRAAAPRP